MESITQNYEKILENLIINNFSEIIKKNKPINPNENKVFNYIKILDTLDERICDIAKKSLIAIFDSLDRGFKNSPERRHRYHIKAHATRTIMTIFGEITYKKTIYQHKHNYTSFCFIDDYLGLKKYDYFDPYIKATVLEYAANYPCTKVAKMINDLIEKRIHLKEPFQYISKQTIRNIILSSPISKPNTKELETPENLYVMADEKFVPTQNNNHEDVMIKSIVIFDGREKKNKRTNLLHKYIFANYNSKDLINEFLNYLYYHYDLDKVKNIFIMGDGASWIKNLRWDLKPNNNVNISFNLDKFHFKQALHHIALDTNIEEMLKLYVLSNSKNDFIKCCDDLVNSFPYRLDTIESKKQYILNNWNYINNLYENDLYCPMESQISHNLADLLTSRPKAYSLKTLDKLLKLRLLFKNNHNIKLLFLNNFNKKEILNFNQESLNFSLFDKKYNLPSLNKNLIPINYHENFSVDNTAWGFNFSSSKIYKF